MVKGPSGGTRFLDNLLYRGVVIALTVKQLSSCVNNSAPRISGAFFGHMTLSSQRLLVPIIISKKSEMVKSVSLPNIEKQKSAYGFSLYSSPFCPGLPNVYQRSLSKPWGARAGRNPDFQGCLPNVYQLHFFTWKGVLFEDFLPV